MDTEKNLFSKKAKEFRSLCRSYTARKRWLYTLQKEHSMRVREGEDTEQDPGIHRMETQIHLLQEALVRTEELLEKIEERFGEEAADIVMQVYVEQTGLQKIAERQGISVRTLQRRIRAWLEEVL